MVRFWLTFGVTRLTYFQRLIGRRPNETDLRILNSAGSHRTPRWAPFLSHIVINNNVRTGTSFIQHREGTERLTGHLAVNNVKHPAASAIANRSFQFQPEFKDEQHLKTGNFACHYFSRDGFSCCVGKELQPPSLRCRISKLQDSMQRH